MAADILGRVHLVYSDASLGFNYALCAADCSNVGSWTAVRLDQGGSSGSALAVDGAGRLAALNPVTGTGELRYLSCFGECLDAFSWELRTVERPNIFGSPPPGPPRLAYSSDFGLRMAYNTAAHDLYVLE
jgi:hypothetical protein